MISRDDAARGATWDNFGEARDGPRARWLAALAGLLSGLAAFGIGEAAYNRIPAKQVMLNTMGTIAPAVTGATQAVATVRNAAVACGVLGLCLGGGLGIAGGLSRRSRSATLKAGVLGATLGAALAGGVSLALLQSFEDARLAYFDYDSLISIGMHGLTWGLTGAAGGMAFAVGLGRPWLIVRATLAGLLGAVLGAIAFDLFGAVFFPLAQTNDPVSTTWPSRLVARLWVTIATAACVILVLPGPVPDPAPKRSWWRRS